MKKQRLMIAFLIALIVYVAILMVNINSKPNSNIGSKDGRLADCPNSPNCVSSQTEDPTKSMSPFRYDGTPVAAWDQLVRIVDELPGTKIVTNEAGYLHVECSSLVFRFVDDLEFLIDDKSNQIHFRSASRIGHSDLGANRKRIELIKEKFK